MSKCPYNICAIIPTYNNAGTVRQVIDDVLKHCDQVIVVNDGSTDETAAILQAPPAGVTVVQYPVNKAQESGAKEVWLTERGNMMGYNNLVVDFRNIPDMLELVPKVIMDCTHSVQRPGGSDGKTGGDRRFVPMMAMAAKAFGATGYFFEVHPEPDKGLSDAANMLELEKLEALVERLIED